VVKIIGYGELENARELGELSYVGALRSHGTMLKMHAESEASAEPATLVEHRTMIRTITMMRNSAGMIWTMKRS